MKVMVLITGTTTVDVFVSVKVVDSVLGTVFVMLLDSTKVMDVVGQ